MIQKVSGFGFPYPSGVANLRAGVRTRRPPSDYCGRHQHYRRYAVGAQARCRAVAAIPADRVDDGLAGSPHRTRSHRPSPMRTASRPSAMRSGHRPPGVNESDHSGNRQEDRQNEQVSARRGRPGRSDHCVAPPPSGLVPTSGSSVTLRLLSWKGAGSCDRDRAGGKGDDNSGYDHRLRDRVDAKAGPRAAPRDVPKTKENAAADQVEGEHLRSGCGSRIRP